VKNFLSQTMKYINTELKRCELGEEKVMEGYLNCNNIDSSNGVSNTIDALTNVPAFKDNYEQGVLKEFRNPYDNSKPAVRKATAYTLGQVSISLAGKKIQLETCFKSGCGPLDRAENLIDFDQIF